MSDVKVIAQMKKIRQMNGAWIVSKLVEEDSLGRLRGPKPLKNIVGAIGFEEVLLSTSLSALSAPKAKFQKLTDVSAG